MTIEDDRIERAAQLAWETFAAEHEHADELWRHQRPERQARWRKIAFAMLVFMQPSEQVRRLESQLTGLRRAYDQACEQPHREQEARQGRHWARVAAAVRAENTRNTAWCRGCRWWWDVGARGQAYWRSDVAALA